MDEYRGLRDAFNAKVMDSQANMLAFSKLLASVSAADLKKIDHKTVSGAFKDHRFMADYAVLLLHQASESLMQEKPDIDEVQEALGVGILALQLQRMAFEQASKAGFEISKLRASSQGKVGADGLHNKEGGSRWKVAEIRRIWRTKKYENKDLCAEQECAALEMSFSSARKALRGVPRP